ncbi:MAG: hypothetical protein JWN86_3495 [Planctomycetota bacterium]|nr:hypothetical protein [Planctomycetota bacterium]
MAASDPDHPPGSGRRTENARSRRPRAPLGLEILESRVLLSVSVAMPRTAARPVVAVIEHVPTPHATAGLGHAKTISTHAVGAVAGKTVSRWTISSAEVRTGTTSSLGLGAASLPVAAPDPPRVIQRLPDQPQHEVASSLASEEAMRLYGVPLHSATRSVRIDLSVPATADPSVAERLWLIDGTGAVVGHWPLPEPGAGVSIQLDAADAFAEDQANLFVGISRDGIAASEIAPPAPFLLVIGREDGPSPIPVPAPSRRDAALDLVLTVGPLGMPSPPVAAPPPQTAPTMAEMSLGLGQEASGPLPMRSAGPSAGVLADGQSIPRIGPLDGTVVDLTLIDIPTEPVPPPPPEPSSIDGLAPIRSPGGFPLLGSASSQLLAESATPSLFLTGDAPGVDDEAESDDLPSPITGPPDSDTRPGRRRPTAAITLGVATAITFGLLLPDLATRFAPEFPRRPLPWGLRKRS